jgi:hypothetical protein
MGITIFIWIFLGALPMKAIETTDLKRTRKRHYSKKKKLFRNFQIILISLSFL